MMTLSRWKFIVVAAAVLFGLLFTLPNVLPAGVRDSIPGFLPRKTLNLGLDLQGGSYLLLEVDTAVLLKEKVANLGDDVKKIMTEEAIPIAGVSLQRQGARLQLVNPGDTDKAYKLLSRQIPQPLHSRAGTDVRVSRDGADIVMVFTDDGIADQAAMAVEQSIEIIRRRVDELGTKEPSIARQGANRIVIQVPGESDPERLKAVIGKTAKLTFQMVDDQVTAAEVEGGAALPPGAIILPYVEGRQGAEVVRRRVDISGESLSDARLANDPQTGAPTVAIKFDSQGAKKFGQITTKGVNKRFAMVLDGKVLSAPNINEPILGGNAVISGGFTTEDANNLSIMLRNGALPAPLKVEEQRTVGAELGADAVEAGRNSTVVGFMAILVFMLLSYGLLFGGISVIALIVNGLLIIAAMSATQATLTLPGIAGIILTLAVAVDANVLIYERMRDEVRAGRPLVSAMDAGFSRAMETIIDANLTTLLAALIMFKFGAGPVKGFAWTLSIGVITSVFTAVVVTQLLLGLWFRLTRPKTLPIA